MLKWVPPAVADRVLSSPMRAPMDTSYRPNIDSPYRSLVDKPIPDDERTDYYQYSSHVKKYRRGLADNPSDLTWSELRSRENMKLASIESEKNRDKIKASLIGGALGFVGGRYIAKKVIKGIPPELKFLLRDKVRDAKIKAGLVGAAGGSVVSYLASSFDSRNRESDAEKYYRAGYESALMNKAGSSEETVPEGHIFITDVGPKILPEHVAPKEIQYSYHFDHPHAKYLPLLGTAAGAGSSALYDYLIKKKKPSAIKALLLATLGGGAGTVKMLHDQEAYANPYRADYINKVEKKYNTKYSNDGNEYITDTGFSTMPFDNTLPPDIDTGYHFKYPLAKYSPLVGGLGGLGAIGTYSYAKKVPISVGKATFAAMTGSALGTLISQIHKDIKTKPFKDSYIKHTNYLYSKEGK